MAKLKARPVDKQIAVFIGGPYDGDELPYDKPKVHTLLTVPVKVEQSLIIAPGQELTQTPAMAKAKYALLSVKAGKKQAVLTYQFIGMI